MSNFIELAIGFSYFIFGIGLLQTVLMAVQAVVAVFVFRADGANSEIVQFLVSHKPEFCPSITIIVPAYNEEVTLGNSVANLLSLNYQNYDIVVVNDGSKDHTLHSLKSRFELKPTVQFVEEQLPHQKIRTLFYSSRHPNLWVVDKENGGKADAINAGINVSRSDLFCVIDADSILDADALKKVIRPFIEYPDTAVAAGGVISGINNLDIQSGRVLRTSVSNSILQNIQTLEYYRCFLIGRMFWDVLDSNFLISGAFGLFRKDAVVAVGGYRRDTVGEDLDLIFKLQLHFLNRQKNSVFFVSDPVCWTETPHSLRGLGLQRNRWQRGMLDILVTYRRELFTSKNRLFGGVVLPFLWVTEVLFVPAALIGYCLAIVLYFNGLLSVNFFVAFFSLEVLLGVIVSVLALMIKEWQEAEKSHPLDIFRPC